VYGTPRWYFHTNWVTMVGLLKNDGHTEQVLSGGLVPVGVGRMWEKGVRG
jgi:hypothetical protein